MSLSEDFGLGGCLLALPGGTLLLGVPFGPQDPPHACTASFLCLVHIHCITVFNSVALCDRKRRRERERERSKCIFVYLFFSFFSLFPLYVFSLKEFLSCKHFSCHFVCHFQKKNFFKWLCLLKGMSTISKISKISVLRNKWLNRYLVIRQNHEFNI